MRLRVLRDVLDAALGGHGDTLEDEDGEAPEADRGLVQDPSQLVRDSWHGAVSDVIGGITEGEFLIGCRYYGVSDPSLVNTPKWTIYTVECSHCWLSWPTQHI